GARCELVTERPHFTCPVTLIAFEREWQADHDVCGAVLGGQVGDRLNGRTLASATGEDGERLCDRGSGITDGDANTALAVVDTDDAGHSAEAGQGRIRFIPSGNALIDSE